MFRQFQTLNSLRIKYSWALPIPPVPANHEIVSLPVLTSLTLTYRPRPHTRFSGHPGSDPIFSLLSVPNLTHLRLVYGGEFAIFPTILAQNAITTLSIGLGVPYNVVPSLLKGLSALLQSVPNLRDLVISPPSTAPFQIVYNASPLVELLMDIPLHHLRTLDIRGSFLPGPKPFRLNFMHLFVEMIEVQMQRTRMETVYPLLPLPSIPSTLKGGSL